MATNVGTAYVTILPAAHGFAGRLRSQIGGGAGQAGAHAGRQFGGGFTKAFGGLLAGGAAVKFFTGAISLASDLAENTSKVGVVFQTSSKQIVEASKSSATAVGLSSVQYLEATGNLGNLFVALKIAPKQAAGMSQSMVKLAADMASFNNVPVEEALAAIQSGLVGETEPLRKFGVNMNDATLRAEALKLGLIKSTKDALSPQTKALAANSLIMTQTKTAHGDFARTSGGLANQQRILTARWEDAKTKLGAGLLPAMLAVVSFISNKFLPMFSSLFKAASGSTSGFSALGAFFKGVLIPALKDVVSWFQVHVLPVLKMVGEFVREQVIRWWNVFVDVVTKHVIPAAKAIGNALGNLITFLTPAIKWLLDRLRDMSDFLKATVVPVFKALFDFVKANANWLVPLVAGIGGFIVIWKVVTGLLARNPFVAIAIAVIAIGTLIYKNWDKIKKFFVDLWAAITQSIIQAWDRIKAFFVGIAQWFVKLWQNVTGAIKTAWTAIGKFFQSIATFVVDVFKNSWNWLVTAGKNIVTGLWNGIKDLWKTVVSFFVNIGTTIKNWFVNAATWLLSAGGRIIKGLWDGIVNFFKTIGAWFVSLPRRIGDFFINAVTWLLKAGADVIRGLVTGMVNFLTEPLKVFGPVGDAIIRGLKKVLQIDSPSKRMIPLGQMLAKGMVLGLLKENPEDAAVKVFGGIPDAVKALFKAGKFTAEDIMSIKNPKYANLMSSILGGLGAGFGGGGLGAGFAGATTGGNLQQWISRAVAITGVPTSWIRPLMSLAMHESGGNPLAQNNWDSNAMAGIPSKGLLQTIVPTFNAYSAPGMKNIWDPVHNAVAAIFYMLARYGSIFNIASYTPSGFVGGYEAGTNYVPQTGLALVHRGEEIIPAGKNAGWSSGPDVLVLIDMDGNLIGRMRVEAAGELDRALSGMASAMVYGRSS